MHYKSEKAFLRFIGFYNFGFYNQEGLADNYSAYKRKRVDGKGAFFSFQYKGMRSVKNQGTSFSPNLCDISTIRICVTDSSFYGLDAEISFLITQRDKNGSDNKMEGYSAVSPDLRVMGGSASVLLNGQPLGRENPPFHNFQERSFFFDSRNICKNYR